MAIGRVRAQVVHAHVEKVALARATEQRHAQGCLEVVGEGREHVDAHDNGYR